MLPNKLICLSFSNNPIFSTVSTNHYMPKEIGFKVPSDTNLEKKYHLELIFSKIIIFIFWNTFIFISTF